MVPNRNQEVPMPALTIKGIPDELLERLRRSAEANRRSLNADDRGSLRAARRSRDDRVEGRPKTIRAHVHAQGPLHLNATR
jgi:plasmid stability protein